MLPSSGGIGTGVVGVGYVIGGGGVVIVGIVFVAGKKANVFYI